MISTKLMGGLGNQMFQIATTHALALRNKTEAKFNFDTCFTPLQGHTSNKYKDNIFKNIKTYSGNYNFKNYYKEPKHSYSPIPYSEDLLLDGYWQSELYFKDFKKEIIDLFYFSKENIQKCNQFLMKFTNPNITSVHIRRGDYQKFPNIHPTCTVEYYKEAMEKIGDSDFLFIADDMDWVEKNFKGNNIHYSPFDNEILDMTLMTMVDNNIIANSSFSWWGAYLNGYEDKIVIGPKTWFHKDANIDDSTIIAENWIKI